MIGRRDWRRYDARDIQNPEHKPTLAEAGIDKNLTHRAAPVQSCARSSMLRHAANAKRPPPLSDLQRRTG